MWRFFPHVGGLYGCVFDAIHVSGENDKNFRYPK
jgi:hypothetical protein